VIACLVRSRGTRPRWEKWTEELSEAFDSRVSCRAYCSQREAGEPPPILPEFRSDENCRWFSFTSAVIECDDRTVAVVTWHVLPLRRGGGGEMAVGESPRG